MLPGGCNHRQRLWYNLPAVTGIILSLVSGQLQVSGIKVNSAAGSVEPAGYLYNNNLLGYFLYNTSIASIASSNVWCILCHDVSLIKL